MSSRSFIRSPRRQHSDCVRIMDYTPAAIESWSAGIYVALRQFVYLAVGDDDVRCHLPDDFPVPQQRRHFLPQASKEGALNAFGKLGNSGGCRCTGEGLHGLLQSTFEHHRQCARRQTNVAEVGVFGRGLEDRATWPTKRRCYQLWEMGRRRGLECRMESSVDLIAPEFRPYGNGCAAVRLQYSAHLT